MACGVKPLKSPAEFPRRAKSQAENLFNAHGKRKWPIESKSSINEGELNEPEGMLRYAKRSKPSDIPKSPEGVNVGTIAPLTQYNANNSTLSMQQIKQELDNFFSGLNNGTSPSFNLLKELKQGHFESILTFLFKVLDEAIALFSQLKGHYGEFSSKFKSTEHLLSSIESYIKEKFSGKLKDFVSVLSTALSDDDNYPAFESLLKTFSVSSADFLNNIQNYPYLRNMNWSRERFHNIADLVILIYSNFKRLEQNNIFIAILLKDEEYLRNMFFPRGNSEEGESAGSKHSTAGKVVALSHDHGLHNIEVMDYNTIRKNNIKNMKKHISHSAHLQTSPAPYGFYRGTYPSRRNRLERYDALHY